MNAQAPLPTHSPLGASGASRWMKCPGSVPLSVGIEDEEDDTFSAPGTAAHAIAEAGLSKDYDAWHYVNMVVDAGSICDVATFDDKRHAETIKARGQTVTVEMANAVQVYLDAVRKAHPDRNQGNSWVERSFHCPTIHPLFYGTADFIHWDEADKTLHVWDYKHGAGIIVEVPWNAQTMYYACGALEDLQLWPKVDHVVLHIAQPRGFHWDGPVREWSISTDDLQEWLEDELIPAMRKAEVSRDTTAGEHCRFCPVRAHACPAILETVDELEALVELANEKGGAAKLSSEQVGRLLDLFDIHKIAAKAAENTAFMRLSAGHAVPGRKLANKRAHREWKPGAEKALKIKFGKQAFTEPELKSPAQIDELPEGEKLTARWSAKPDTGLTVVKDSDARPAINREVKSLFKPVKQKKGA